MGRTNSAQRKGKPPEERQRGITRSQEIKGRNSKNSMPEKEQGIIKDAGTQNHEMGVEEKENKEDDDVMNPEKPQHSQLS